MNLLNDALEHDVIEMAHEETGVTNTLHSMLGRNLVLLKEGNTHHEDLIAFLDVNMIEMENADKLEAVTRLNADVTALEIAMKTLARITQLSLATYLRTAGRAPHLDAFRAVCDRIGSLSFGARASPPKNSGGKTPFSLGRGRADKVQVERGWLSCSLLTTARTAR
ncbi:MAG: hypothetical protein FD153_1905 [Rhodospirillaceae bacterium]|nr:MAG: hypothetical protein FD153_1905 [Rhodospirillaceae bacterium]